MPRIAVDARNGSPVPAHSARVQRWRSPSAASSRPRSSSSPRCSLDTITVTGGEEPSAVRLVVPARAGY